MKRLFYFYVLFLLETAALANERACPDGMKLVPLNPENWTSAYTGYGEISFNDGVAQLAPRAARSPQSTHASLALSKLELPADDFKLQVEYRNIQALRAGPPNPWELLWIFFQYRNGSPNGKTTNYVVAKTNGLEIGKAFGEVDQVFLKTTEAPRANFRDWHLLSIERAGNQLRIQLNAEPAMIWNEESISSSASRLFHQKGQIGLYTEDARVSVRKVCVSLK